MFEDTASFLSFQIRRSTESGDFEKAMDQLQRYLELERETKLPSGQGLGHHSSKVHPLPRLRTIS